MSVTTCNHDTKAQRHLELADYVASRLDEAGVTLMALPSSGYGLGIRIGHPEIVREMRESYGWQGAAPRVTPPSSEQITRMDEAIGWLTWLPEDRRQLRWLVGKRILTNPVTLRRYWSGRRLADHLGISEMQVRRRFDEAVAIIAKKLSSSSK